jgi:hypothetical protein
LEEEEEQGGADRRGEVEPIAKRDCGRLARVVVEECGDLVTLCFKTERLDEPVRLR